MSAQAGFLSDIIEHPDDDTPRLVYADWLEENGDPDRAEFIRVQIERARLAADDPRQRALEQREEELLQLHRDAWLGALQKLSTELRFVRGFVESIKLGVRQFLSNAEELFSQLPIRYLQLLRLNQTNVDPAEITARPELKRLRGFSLAGGRANDEKMLPLLSAANLAGIEELDISGTAPGAKTLRFLGSDKAPRLRVLDLGGVYLARQSIQQTLSNKRLQLQRLNLAGTALPQSAFEGIAQWHALARVEDLNLAGTSPGAAGAERLAACPFLSRLRRLDLGHCNIGIRGMRALAGAADLAGVVYLNLTGNNLKRAGLNALISSPHLTLSEGLYLGTNALDDECLTDLANWPGLARHRILDLGSNAFTDVGVQA